MTIAKEQAVSELVSVKKRFEAAIESFKRKRSWRASEKAMAIASYKMEIEALDLAIQCLSKND